MKEAIATLEKYNFLQECVLKEIRWVDYCTNVDLIFNNIWSSNGNLRTDLIQERLLILSFRFVQEFLFFGGLSEEILLNTDQINWGINEISVLRIEKESALLDKYDHLKSNLNHISIVWEGDRKIDLVFNNLKIMQQL